MATAKQSVRVSGGLPLLVGGLLLLVSLFLPWVVAGNDRNAFEYLPAVAVLWAVVGLWSLGLALTLAGLDGRPRLGALAVLAGIALASDLLIVLSAVGSTGARELGGGPSLALIALIAILLGVSLAEERPPSATKQPPEG